MANPVTGPLVSSGSRSGHGPGTYRWEKSKYRQAKPYNLALPYYAFLGTCLSSNYSPISPDNAGASSNNWTTGSTKPLRFSSGEAYGTVSKAMDNFRGQVTERAEWLVNLAERKQAINMISVRGLQLARFARAAKRGDFIGAARALNVGKTVKKPLKTAADIWLELHFGWVPLIKDIGSSVDILQQPFKKKSVFGRSRSQVEMYHKSEFPGAYKTNVTRTLEVKAQVGSWIEVENPNLWLANQAGFVNPASVAWELVPFSFVVDWFIPVGAFLNSFTEFLGLSLKGTYSNSRIKEVVRYELIPLTGGISYSTACQAGETFERVATLPDSSLKIPPLGGLSITRAATAISLLLQQLK